MARIRTIKPEFWKHEDLSALPEITHMLAAALLGYADDEGYFNANPALVRSECLPLRESSVSTQTSLQQLVEIGYLQIGRGEDGKRYGRVVKFDEHQRVNRPTPSKIKAIGIVWEDSVTTHAGLSEPSSPEGKGTGKGREEENSSCAAPASPSPAVDLLPAEPPVISFLLNDGSEFGLSQQQLDEFQQLWTRIRIDGLLRHCLDGLPEDAGPLHSSVLTYRAMALMREVCPDYLQHFVAYTDALSWLEQLGGGTAGGNDGDGAAAARRPTRSQRRKKPQ